MKTIIKFVVNAVVAWLVGCLFITLTLYLSNAGADFTMTDIMGFSVLSIIASGILMLVVYTPSVLWLRRRQGGISPRHRFPLLTGVVCNIPVFIMFALLIDRKMPAAEAFGFMLTFLVIGGVLDWDLLCHKNAQKIQIETSCFCASSWLGWAL